MQLRFTPEKKRRKQLDAAEKLFAIIDKDKEYPFEFVFFRITLPMLTPYIITAALFRMLESIQQFDIIYAMTQGGPGNSLMVFQVSAYLERYQYTNVGRSAAILMVLWAITFLLSNIFIKQWLRLRERARGVA